MWERLRNVGNEETASNPTDRMMMVFVCGRNYGKKDYSCGFGHGNSTVYGKEVMQCEWNSTLAQFKHTGKLDRVYFS